MVSLDQTFFWSVLQIGIMDDGHCAGWNAKQSGRFDKFTLSHRPHAIIISEEKNLGIGMRAKGRQRWNHEHCFIIRVCNHNGDSLCTTSPAFGPNSPIFCGCSETKRSDNDDNEC
eukprot:GABV01002410.1.p1 GENE.GABV01002410.1~~GABV01002410.1.p1  ORF type:complete len:115 (-),score=3.77 GABV01002410.1:176-520(-)